MFEEELTADMFRKEVEVFVIVIDVVMYKIDCEVTKGRKEGKCRAEERFHRQIQSPRFFTDSMNRNKGVKVRVQARREEGNKGRRGSIFFFFFS